MKRGERSTGSCEPGCALRWPNLLDKQQSLCRVKQGALARIGGRRKVIVTMASRNAVDVAGLETLIVR